MVRLPGGAKSFGSGLLQRPRVRDSATRRTIKMHKTLDKHDSIHGDSMCSGLSLDTPRSKRLLCLLIATTSLYALEGMGQRLQNLAHGMAVPSHTYLALC